MAGYKCYFSFIIDYDLRIFFIFIYQKILATGLINWADLNDGYNNMHYAVYKFSTNIVFFNNNSTVNLRSS